MSATNIDGVVAALDAILERSVAAHDRRGYFAALYNQVTLRVRDGITEGRVRGRRPHGAARRDLRQPLPRRLRRVRRAWRRRSLPPGSVRSTPPSTGITRVMVIPAPAPRDERAHHARPRHRRSHHSSRRGRRIDGLAGRLRPDQHPPRVARLHRRGRADRHRRPLGVPLGASVLWLAERAAHGGERSAAGLLMDKARDAAWRFAKIARPLDADAAAAHIRCHDEETTLLSDVLLDWGARARVDGRRPPEHPDHCATGELPSLDARQLPAGLVRTTGSSGRCSRSIRRRWRTPSRPGPPWARCPG